MLAEREMELCISESSFEDNQRFESVNGKIYLVMKEIEKKDNLVTITIEVRSHIKNRRLVKLQIQRLLNE